MITTHKYNFNRHISSSIQFIANAFVSVGKQIVPYIYNSTVKSLNNKYIHP